MRTHAVILASVLSLAVVTTVKANLLVNGGLESVVAPTQPDNLVYMKVGSNAHALGSAWSITSGAVDIVPNSYFQSSQGGYSVDLVGTPGVGVISQTVTTVIGNTYQMLFDYSVNPENLTGEVNSSKAIKITATGTGQLATQTYTYSGSTPTKANMNYISDAEFNFTANSTSTTITITALLSNLPAGRTPATAYCGPVIDNLDLESTGSILPPDGGGGGGVPEPASLATLGIGGVALLKRRRNKRSA